MKISKMTSLTKICIDLMFYTGFLVCLTLPWSMQFISKIFHFNVYQTYYREMLVLFEIAGVLGIIIIWNLRKIFKTVIDKDCFVHQNVKSLKIMGGSSFAICIVMACRLFFVITPSILVLVLVFLLSGLFSFVLSQVFDTAIVYKEENELTI